MAASSLSSGAMAAADDLVVGFRTDAPAIQERAARGHGGVVTRRLPVAGLAVVEPRGDRTGASLAEELANDPRVRFVEPNGTVRRLLTPDDASFGAQWGLLNTGQRIDGVTGMAGADIAAPGAWDVTTGSSAVRVAVLDGGVDRTVPDLAPNAPAVLNAQESGDGRESNGVDDDGNGFVDDVAGWDWVADDNDPDDADFVSHGTHVASVIAARGNDGQGMAGVTWSASLMPLRVLNAFGFGSVADVVAGLSYAGQQGARVVNVSLGGEVSGQTMQAAIDAYPNTLFVVAAGNAGDDNDGSSPSMPCAVPSENVICVAASDQGDDLASFSNFGATTVDLAAPGVNVLGATRGGGLQVLDGTSFSAPHVAGVAALILAREPTASSAQVKRAILDGATPVAGLAGTTATGARLSALGALGSVPPAGAAPAIASPSAEARDGGSALLRASIDPDGSPTTYHVEWGTDTGYGSQSSVRRLDAPGSPASVAETITGLQPGTTYHARFVAADIDGVTVGPDLVFTTPAEPAPGDAPGGPPAGPTEPDDSSVIGRPSASPSTDPGDAEPTAAEGSEGPSVSFRRRGSQWRAVIDLPADSVVSGLLQRRVIHPPRAGRGARSRFVSVRGLRRRGYRAGRRQFVLGRLKSGTHRLVLRVRAGGSERVLLRGFRVSGPGRPRAALLRRGDDRAVVVTVRGPARVSGRFEGSGGRRIASLRNRRLADAGRVRIPVPAQPGAVSRVRVTVWEPHRATRLTLRVPAR